MYKLFSKEMRILSVGEVGILNNNIILLALVLYVPNWVWIPVLLTPWYYTKLDLVWQRSF